MKMQLLNPIPLITLGIAALPMDFGCYQGGPCSSYLVHRWNRWMPRARCRRSWRTSGAAPWGAAPRPGTAAPAVAVGLLAAAALPASDQRLHYSSSLPTFRNQVNVKVHTTPLAHITNLNALVPLVPILAHAALIHGHGKASFFKPIRGL